MSDPRSLLERESRRFIQQDGAFERLGRRRERKRRNQRIAAGVVGIAVFVGLIWIVTTGLSFDRTETPAVPGPAETGPAETGPAETGPAETGPPPASDSAAPATVVRTGPCSDSATWRLEFRPVGDRFKVRFEVHRSPVGHSWRVVLTHVRRPLDPDGPRDVFFRGTRVATEDGEVVVQRRVWNASGFDGLRAEATDRQTGLACKVDADLW